MNRLVRYFYLLSMLVLYSTVNAQNPWLDSLKRVVVIQKDTTKVKTLLAISETYQLNDPDSSFYFAQQALSLSEKLQSDWGIFWSIVSINKALNTLGNYTLELDYAFRAYPLSKKLNDTYSIGWANGMIQPP